MINQKSFYSICILSLFLVSGYGQQFNPGSPVFGNDNVDGEEIFKVVEEMPRFPGCEESIGESKSIQSCAKEKMLDFIADAIVYPQEAKKNTVEGMAVVQFIVWKDGSIRDIQIMRDPGSGIGEEAVRIIESMKDLEPGWRPGYQMGKPACVQYTLPIKFEVNRKYELRQLDKKPKLANCKKIEDDDCTQKKLEEFIIAKMVYPESDIQTKTEGTVKVKFIIEADGSLSNIKSRSRVSKEMKKDAEAIIQSMNSEGIKWIPGEVDGKPVPTKYSVKVSYNLEDWNSRN